MKITDQLHVTPHLSHPTLTHATLAVMFFFAFCSGSLAAADVKDDRANVETRKPWTTSRVNGSPEPPLPYRAQRVFTGLSFEKPTVLTNAPSTDRLFVAEQKGKIFSIPNDPNCKQADLFLDVNKLVERLNTMDTE